MSFTPPPTPWLRLPSHCYLMPTTAPMLTTNTQYTRKTGFLENGESVHDAARHLITAAEACLPVFALTQIIRRGQRLLELGTIFSFFFFSAKDEERTKWRERWGKAGKRVKLGWVESRTERDLHKSYCSGARREIKLHPEQGKEEAMWRWVRCGEQVGGDKAAEAEQRLSGVEATL